MMDTKKGFQLHDALFFVLLVFCFYFTRNIVCSLMMVLFFGYTFLRLLVNRRKIVIPFFCVGFLIFILYGFVNILVDNVLYKSVAQTMAISLTLNLLMMFAVIQYVLMQRDVPKVLHILESAILVTTLVVVFLSVDSITEGRLASGTEMNSNRLSMLCVHGFVLVLYLRKIQKISLISCVIQETIYLLSTLLTGSRKGLIMIVLAIVIINLTSEKRKIISTILIGVAAAVTLYILIMNIPILYDIMGVRIENLIVLLTEGTTEEGSLISRQKLIDIGMMYIKEKPWTGYGLDCFKMISGIGGSGNVGAAEVGYYSHNNYIELLFGVGIVGMILYYIPMVSTLKKLLQALKNNPCVTYLLALFISKLAVEYAYVSYYSRVDAYLMAVIVGILLLVNKEKYEYKVA